MKRTFLTLLIGFLAFGFVSAQESYTMYETMYVTPKKGMEKELKTNMEAHNKKYHATAPYEAFNRSVVIGQHEGDMVWVMGPTTYTALGKFDSQDNSEAHSADWALNVEPFVDSYSDLEYWKRKDDLSYTPEGDADLKLQHLRFWGLKPGKYQDFMGVLKNVVEVFKKNNYKESWGIYVNQFETGNHRDVASVSNMAGWASFDEADTWVADYEKLYGKDSWKAAMKILNDCTEVYTEEVRQ